MVADFKIKDVPRSLVRVPGSGRSQGSAAPAISCDLGRVSSLAATIPVNPSLPAIMTGSKLFVASPINDPANNKLATSPGLVGIPCSPASPSRRRPRNPEAEAETSQEIKRARLGVHTTSMGATNHSMVGGNVPSSQLVVVPATAQSSEGQDSPSVTATRRIVTARRTQRRPVPSPSYSSRSLEELLEEQRNLREENRILLQQLRHYTQMREERQRRMLGIVV